MLKLHFLWFSPATNIQLASADAPAGVKSAFLSLTPAFRISHIFTIYYKCHSTDPFFLFFAHVPIYFCFTFFIVKISLTCSINLYLM